MSNKTPRQHVYTPQRPKISPISISHSLETAAIHCAYYTHRHIHTHTHARKNQSENMMRAHARHPTLSLSLTTLIQSPYAAHTVLLWLRPLVGAYIVAIKENYGPRVARA